MPAILPLIVNPSARRGRAGRRAARIRRFLLEQGLETELILSDGPGHIAEAIGRLAKDGARRVLVAGGDGTVHEAVNGRMQAMADIAIGLIPTGSGNDFAKACGIDTDWRIAAAALAGRIKEGIDPARIDVGRCNDRYFANGIGIGFDAVVTRFAANVNLPVGDFVYVIGLARALARGITTPELIIEGNGFSYRGRVTLANVANGPWIGGQFKIAPTAGNADGKLDLVLAEPLTIRRVLTLLPMLRSGRHLEEKEVRHATLRRVVVTGTEPMPSHLDGEVQPLISRFDIECLPGELGLL